MPQSLGALGAAFLRLSAKPRACESTAAPLSRLWASMFLRSAASSLQREWSPKASSRSSSRIEARAAPAAAQPAAVFLLTVSNSCWGDGVRRITPCARPSSEASLPQPSPPASPVATSRGLPCRFSRALSSP